MHMGKVGHALVYSTEEEAGFEEAIITVGDWGFPMGVQDLRDLVHAYNIQQNRHVAEFAKNSNIPGRDWIEGFLKRHPTLTQRLASNIKRVRAEVSHGTIKAYFENLSNSLRDIPPENIFNYDETNFTDDPGKFKVISAKGRKYVERVLNATKSALSVMFCGSASGVLLPPYFCYKSQLMWENWPKNLPRGPPFCSSRCCKNGCRINRSNHGWFDGVIFTDWFKTSFLPHAKRLEGNVALIGDNLRSHFTEEVIKLAKENNILFICLPPNSTHLTQPLDVCFFRPVKVEWRRIITEYKMQNHSLGPLDKMVFPQMFKKLFQEGKLLENSSKNLQSGFAKSGIYPLDVEKVLNRIPASPGDSERSASSLSDAVLDRLSELRYGNKSDNNPRPKRGKNLNVPAGHSVAHYEEDDDQPSTSGAPTAADLSKLIDDMVAGLLINHDDSVPPPNIMGVDHNDVDLDEETEY